MKPDQRGKDFYQTREVSVWVYCGRVKDITKREQKKTIKLDGRLWLIYLVNGEEDNVRMKNKR